MVTVTAAEQAIQLARDVAGRPARPGVAMRAAVALPEQVRVPRPQSSGNGRATSSLL